MYGMVLTLSTEHDTLWKIEFAKALKEKSHLKTLRESVVLQTGS